MKFSRPQIYFVFPDPVPVAPKIRGGKWQLGFRFASKRGPERIITGYGVMTVSTFRLVRDTYHAWIETDDRERICTVLGVTVDEPGIRSRIPQEQGSNI